MILDPGCYLPKNTFSQSVIVAEDGGRWRCSRNKKDKKTVRRLKQLNVSDTVFTKSDRLLLNGMLNFGNYMHIITI